MLEEDVVVPARAEINLPTKVQFHRLPTSVDDGDFGELIRLDSEVDFMSRGH